jgi:hypothetical protein
MFHCISMHHRKMVWDVMEWPDLWSGPWRALVCSVTKIPWNTGKFLSSCSTGDLSRQAQLHGVILVSCIKSDILLKVIRTAFFSNHPYSTVHSICHVRVILTSVTRRRVEQSPYNLLPSSWYSLIRQSLFHEHHLALESETKEIYGTGSLRAGNN